MKIGDLAITVIERGDKIGVRLKDPNAGTRQRFLRGANGSRRIRCLSRSREVFAYTKPKKIAITNILGMTD